MAWPDIALGNIKHGFALQSMPYLEKLVFPLQKTNHSQGLFMCNKIQPITDIEPITV